MALSERLIDCRGQDACRWSVRTEQRSTDVRLVIEAGDSTEFTEAEVDVSAEVAEFEADDSSESAEVEASDSAEATEVEVDLASTRRPATEARERVGVDVESSGVVRVLGGRAAEKLIFKQITTGGRQQ